MVAYTDKCTIPRSRVRWVGGLIVHISELRERVTEISLDYSSDLGVNYGANCGCMHVTCPEGPRGVNRRAPVYMHTGP